MFDWAFSFCLKCGIHASQCTCEGGPFHPEYDREAYEREYPNE